MVTGPETTPGSSSSYRSPWRVLARAFEKSRDRWKAKSMTLRGQVKAFRAEVRDLRRSRDRWQSKAEDLKHQLDDLRAEIRCQGEPPPPAPN
jgi:predicted RNase H-like nuclease (RuvC/YqgF family)